MSEFDRSLALTSTPMIITADMDAAELEYEFELMMTRSAAAASLIYGQISIDDYLDTIAECGVDVDEALEEWTSDPLLMAD
jgi:hypothetical protein